MGSPHRDGLAGPPQELFVENAPLLRSLWAEATFAVRDFVAILLAVCARPAQPAPLLLLTATHAPRHTPTHPQTPAPTHKTQTHTTHNRKLHWKQNCEIIPALDV
jgi:hypothetical protein